MLGRKKDVVEEDVYVPEPGTPFFGPHCFAEGFYYPVLNDEHSKEVGPNFDMPLVWKDDGLVHAAPADSNHFHTYGLNPVELVLGDE